MNQHFLLSDTFLARNLRVFDSQKYEYVFGPKKIINSFCHVLNLSCSIDDANDERQKNSKKLFHCFNVYFLLFKVKTSVNYIEEKSKNYYIYVGKPRKYLGQSINQGKA